MGDLHDFIENRINRINRFKDAIFSGEAKSNRHNDLKSAIFDASLHKTIALYSSKASQETVTQSLLESITAFEEGFRWEGFEKSYAMYDQMIWILSLAILCEISNDDFKRIVAVLKRDNARDRLIKTLVNYRLPDELSTGSVMYIQRSPYAALDMTIIGYKKGIDFLKNYLQKQWYQGHKDAPWYDAHKNTKVNTFFGYWSWEAAALVKIHSIDDASLKDQEYYPYRSVHW